MSSFVFVALFVIFTLSDSKMTSHDFEPVIEEAVSVEATPAVQAAPIAEATPAT